MSLIPIDEVVHFDAITSHPTTGAAADADSTPTFDVYEEATDTGLLGATNLTKRTSLTGDYRGTFTASAANGFEAGKWYNVIVSATVNAIAGKGVVLTFRVAPAETSAGVPQVRASAIADGAISAPTLASDTITDAKVASDVTIASVTGAVGSVTGAVGSVTGAVGSVTGLTASDVGAIKAKTDNLPSDPADQSIIIAATDAIVSAIAALNNLSQAQVLTQVNAALDTQLADSIPADGTIPTLRQALYMDHLFLWERTVSGTTVTVKKADGSSTLATLTINDATAPTSITRAS